jgi:hypothetical protein
MEMSMTGAIAVCGLDCGTCDIRRVPFDPDAAQRVAAWFCEMGWLTQEEGVQQVLERSMYCKGCRGDRLVHWSADCEILTCCVDERGLEFCSQCIDFPCARLTDRARDNARYAGALQRLRDMR